MKSKAHSAFRCQISEQALFNFTLFIIMKVYIFAFAVIFLAGLLVQVYAMRAQDWQCEKDIDCQPACHDLCRNRYMEPYCATDAGICYCGEPVPYASPGRGVGSARPPVF